jgi:purine-binding chemotaxis protein CheW
VAGPGATLSVLTFRAGSADLAIAASVVGEVARVPAMTRVPHAPPSLVGLANLRGAVMPVVRASRLLGQDDTGLTSGSRAVVLDLEPPLALLVDAVSFLTDIEVETGAATRLYVRGEQPNRVIDLQSLLQAGFARHATAPSGNRTAGRAERAPETAPTGAAAGRVLLGVRLGEQAYALPLACIEEVTAPPAALAALPRPDVADLGVAPYRGGVLPVVSLAVLLGMRQGRPVETGRMVVIRIGGARIGLVVDALEAILRAPESAIGPVPAALNRGGGEAGIEAIARIGAPPRIVAILSVEQLFRPEALQAILAEGHDRADSESMVEDLASEAAERFLIFRLGDEDYALPIATVQEVVHLPGLLTRLPNTPDFIEGVFAFRGAVIPIIDQSRRFGAGASGAEGRRVIITSIGALQAGFIVDAVSEILPLDAGVIEPAPDLLSDEDAVFDRVARVGERTILIVDPEALLNEAGSDLIQALGAPDPASP